MDINNFTRTNASGTNPGVKKDIKSIKAEMNDRINIILLNGKLKVKLPGLYETIVQLKEVLKKI